MVWRQSVKVISALVIACAICAATLAPVSAAEPYDGNISTTYIDFFRDIVSGASLLDNYVAWRSGQYEYSLLLGDLVFADGVFSIEDGGEAILYTITYEGGYNTAYQYSTSVITQYELTVGSSLVYSDLGEYPHLISMGEHYEVLATVTLCAMCIFVLFGRILRKR